MSTRPPSSSLRRNAKRSLAAVAAASLAVVGLAPAAVAQPTDDDVSGALAELIDLDALGLDAVDVNHVGAGNESSPGPNRSNIGVDLVDELIGVTLPGLGLPVISDGEAPGLLYLGQAGVLNGYAAAESPQTSAAATGVVTEEGEISLDLVEGDPSSTEFARVNLTDLTTQLGVDLDGVVDEISLGLGALASSASQTTGGQPESDYVVAGADLVIDSPAVGDLVDTLNTTIDGLGGTLNAAIGEDGLVDDVLGEALPIDVVLDLGLLAELGIELSDPQITLDVDLGTVTDGLLDEPLVSDSGLTTIDLNSGLITIDLEQIHAEGLNGLDPNTPLLTSDELTAITTEITDLLAGVVGAVTEGAQDLLDTTELTIDLSASLTARAVVLPVTVAAGVGISGSLADFAGQSDDAPEVELDVDLGLVADLLEALGIRLAELEDIIVDLVLEDVIGDLVGPLAAELLAADALISETIGDAVEGLLGGLDPILDVLPGLVSVTINEQPTEEPINGEGDLGPDSFTVRALGIDLLPDLWDGVALDLASSSVRVLQVEPELAASPDPVLVGDEVTVDGSGFAPGSTVTVGYTDSGGDPVGDPAEITVGDDGSFEDTRVIPEGTSVGELTVVATDTENDAISATESVMVANPAIAAPAEVEPGETIGTTGSGFVPGSTVSVVYTDSEDQSWTSPPVAVDGAGAFTDDFQLPVSAALGELSVVATDDDAPAVTASDTVEVVAITGVVASVEYDVVAQGGEQVGYGSGYAPGAEVTGAAGPGAALDLGTQTADEDGNVTFEWDVAEDGGLGTHTFTLTAERYEAASAEFEVVAQPVIDASPNYVEPGEQITVDGSDFPADSTVTVEYTDSDGDSIGSFEEIPVGGDGTFEHSLVVPDEADTGELTVEATDEGAPALSASDTVTVVDGSISVSPDQVEPGGSLTVEGDGFAPGEPVMVEFEDSDGSSSTESVEAGDDGGFTLTWPVPDDLPLGDLGVAAEGEDSRTSASDAVEVVAITGVGASVEYDVVAQGGGQVGYGSGYAPGTVVTGFAGPEGELAELGTQAADEDGNVTFTWDIAEDAAAAPHTFALTAERYEAASAEFEVMAQPVIDASPEYVEPGEQITAEGSGFVPVSTVTVRYTDTEGGSWTSAGVEVGPEGTFTDTFNVPGEVASGELIVMASDEDEATALSASDIVTVVDGSIVVSPDEVEPGDDVTIIGGGFAPGETVTVEFQDSGGGTWSESVVADEDGGFSLVWTVPGDAPLGDIDVTATGNDSDTSASDAVDVVAITDVGISVEYEVVPQGGEQVGYGSGYAPGTVVTGAAGPGAALDLGTQTADQDGNVNFDWSVPEDAEVGTHTFELVADRYIDQQVEFNVVQQPEITASPDYVEPGEQVTVEGSDFVPGSTVAVEYTDSAGGSWTNTGVEVGPEGTFTDTFDVPGEVATGELTVGVTDEDAPALSASDAVTVVDAVIEVSPESVEPGQSITVEGDGFAPGETVRVVFQDAGGNEWPQTVDAGDGGEFTLTWPVPDDVALGDLEVVATGDDSAASASDTVDVVAITDVGISVEYEVVPQGGEQVGYGSGYAPGTVVTGAAGPGAALDLGTQTADEDGNVTFTWDVAADAELGTHTFQLTADRYVDQSVNFEVVIQPVITASPDYVEPGEQVTVESSDFVPGSTVAVEYTDSAGESWTNTGVEVGPEGTFTDTFDVPSEVATGELIVMASDEDAATALSASDTVTVVDGSIVVSPDEVEPGGEVTVGGEGFAPGETVTVAFQDSGGDTSDETVEAGDDGQFTLTWPVPGDAPLGDLDVAAEGEDSGTSASDTVEVVAITGVEASVEYDVVPQGSEQIGYGSGYAPGTEVTGTAGPDGSPVDLGTQTADEDGNVVFNWVIAEGAEVGTHTFALTEDRYVDQLVEFDVVEQPVIEASPDQVEPGQAVTVEGSNFGSEESVQLVFTDADDETAGAVTVGAGGDGAFSTSLQLQADVTLGDLDVDATGDETGWTASDSVAVVAISSVDISVEYDVVPQGGEQIGHGSGYAPDTVVTGFAGPEGGRVELGTQLADEDGDVTFNWDIAEDAGVGTYTFELEADRYVNQQVAFDVVARPIIEASPDEVTPGETVAVEGSNFRAESTVGVVYTDSDDGLWTDEVEVDAQGNFTDALTLPADVALGTLNVVATDANDPAWTATDAVDVVAITSVDIAVEYDVVPQGGEQSGFGSGYAPGTQVTGTAGPDGGPVDLGSQAADEDGNVAFEWDIPADAELGTHTFALTAHGYVDQDVDFEVARQPAIQATPDQVEPDQTVTVEGSDFVPNSAVAVVYTDSEGQSMTSPAVAVDDEGVFTDTFRVPTSAALGTLTVEATDADAPAFTASDAVEVVAISSVDIAVEYDVVPQGGEQAGYGSGYAPGTEVTGFAGPEGDLEELGTEAAGEDGNVAFEWDIPAEAALGTHAFELTADRYIDQSVDYEVATQPVVQASPDHLEPGETVTIEGSDFRPESTVTVVYTDSNGETVDSFDDVLVGGDGSVEHRLVVPDEAVTGELTVEVTDEDAPALSASDTVTVVDASIVVSPDEVEPGGDVTVEGEGFAPGETVTVEFEHTDGSTWSESVEADDDGGFTLDWPVPGDAPLGELDVVATGDDSGTSASETIEVVAISSVDIAVEHDQLPRLQEQIGYGSGYAPGTEVQGYMNSSPSIELGTEIADGDGNVTFTWPIPPEAELDTHTFSLEADGYINQSVMFQVVPPSIEVSPDEVEPGESVVVDGEDFAPGESVTVEFEDSEGNAWTEEATAGDDGAFTLEWEVPTDAATGALTVTATADSGSATGTVEILDVTETGASPGADDPSDRLPDAGLGGTTDLLGLAGLVLLMGIGMAIRANRRPVLD